MTAISGIETQDGHVVIGGDSAGVAGYSISVRADPKVFRVGPFLFGICGSFRMGQLLHHTLVVPAHAESLSDYGYMVTVFVDALRQCFQKGGFAWNANGQEGGGTFLVGYHGHLYRVDEDFQIGIPAEGFAAVGCGDQIAHGALYATHDIQQAERRVETSLEAAAHFSAGVRGPFHVMVLQPGLRAPLPVKKPKKAAAKKTAKKKTPVKKTVGRRAPIKTTPRVRG